MYSSWNKVLRSRERASVGFGKQTKQLYLYIMGIGKYIEWHSGPKLLSFFLMKIIVNKPRGTI